MATKLIVISNAEPYYNSYGTRILGYRINMQHSGLHEFKILSAPDLDALQIKVNSVANQWIEKWELAEEKRLKRENIENAVETAEERTTEALETLKGIENILKHTLTIDDTIDWNSLKDRTKFKEKHPETFLAKTLEAIPKPPPPPYRQYPSKPDSAAQRYNPQLGLFDKILPSRKQRKIMEAKKIFTDDIAKWKLDCEKINDENQALKEKYTKSMLFYEEKIQVAKQENSLMIVEWEKRKEEFHQGQQDFNKKIDEWEIAYMQGDESAIHEYYLQVLNNSKYPDSFPKTFEMEYIAETRILIIEYLLPNSSAIPTLKEVKYVQSRKEFKETHITENQQKSIYDKVIYEIALRTIHEIFESDSANWISAVSFNGWVKDINRASGKEENNCILSIQVKKDEFLRIDLANIDPKVCFKSLKGVAGSKLHTLTPIQPILTLVKKDSRFVDGYNVIDKIDTSENLAAMDWEDFEHLIRELFEKELQASGGEVKVTQASRDGGVDAIAFDPDPIRGGKIVIQAKRYTNTVGVSAVRDLYGTVLNEGATKGILVTTADFGPDAYDFAKAKPLTLLSGSNLLHMLAKHGYHANIDIREARQIMKDNLNL